MTENVRSVIVKVVLPLLAIVAAIISARRRGSGWRNQLPLHLPAARSVLMWLGVYAAWMLGTDAVVHWRGPFDFKPWHEAPLILSVLRVLAVGVLGPIAEELVVRGIALSRLSSTQLGERGAVIVLAAAWALVHTDYTATVIGILFVAGLLLGFARVRTRSVLTPMLMHILWNMYAVW